MSVLWQAALVVVGTVAFVLAFVWAMVRTRYPDVLLLMMCVVLVVAAVVTA